MCLIFHGPYGSVGQNLARGTKHSDESSRLCGSGRERLMVADFVGCQAMTCKESFCLSCFNRLPVHRNKKCRTRLIQNRDDE